MQSIKHTLSLLALAVFCSAHAAYVDELKGESFSWDINVRDFGARGDGKADDTAAITAAARAAEKHDFPIRAGSCENDGPHQSIVFPKGVYKVNGTVFFQTCAHLRALGDVTIVGTDPTKDIFYFHRAPRVRVDGFTFIGGRHQLNLATLNREASNFLVRGCRFNKSADFAIKTIGHMVAEGYDDIVVDRGFDIGEFMPDKDGVFRYTPAYAKGKFHNNSTFILFEDCTFDGCAHAVFAHSDGLIIRNSTVRQPAVAGAVFDLNQNFHIYNVDVTVERNVDLTQHVFFFRGCTAALEDIRVKTTNGKGVNFIYSKAWTSSYPASLLMRRCQLECGGCPENAILLCASKKCIALVAMDKIVDTTGKSVRAIGFEDHDEPTEDSLYQANGHFQGVGNGVTFGFALGEMSKNILKRGNETFNRYLVRHPTDLPTPPIAREPIRVYTGKILKATDFGVDTDRFSDDTEGMERFAAALAKAPCAVGVLPSEWILLSRPVTLSGDFALTASGTAGFRHADSKTAFFRVANGAKVKLSNLFFENGQHVVLFKEKEAQPTEIVVENCYSYNAEGYDKFHGAAYDICAGSGAENVRFTMTKGCHYHALLYRGNAHAFLDAFWLRTWPLKDKSEPMDEGVNIKNGRGGVLRITDILGVPCTLRRFPKKAANDPTMKVGDYRWIDNYGEVYSDFVRYGGEYGGLVPFYNYAGAKAYLEGGFAEYKAMSGRQVPALCSSPDADVRFFSTICIQQDIEHPVKVQWRANKEDALKPIARQQFDLVYPLPLPPRK